VTASLCPSFCSVRLKISGTAREAAIGGERRTSFCSGSSMFSNVELGKSAEVYAEITAGVKFEDEERRYCSTRAVSSWSLYGLLACYCAHI
jgi:hypothetical protein